MLACIYGMAFTIKLQWPIVKSVLRTLNLSVKNVQFYALSYNIQPSYNDCVEIKYQWDLSHWFNLRVFHSSSENCLLIKRLFLLIIYWFPGKLCEFQSCQALSISQSLNLSLSLRYRDRADTIITFHHHHPPKTF